MDSTPGTGPSDEDATGRQPPEDGPAETPADSSAEATGSKPPAPGKESLREAVHRRMRELDDRGAEEPAPDGELGPEDEPPD
ncbi:hypothetical protein [Streptomyces sp. TLI_146]|uniref:hypothetical protein n=1 Tax=Streptomyces sp. TLI_146 TaxID=1938858 RepID=UPI000C708609|nr:hypothetical protein [Streptomyces sp. TLI_146]PKV89435.1 hypothetical protein BX283_7071 [Streptomyces sp. TLI_146]